MNEQLHKIPEFERITSLLKCNNCKYYHDCEPVNPWHTDEINIHSRYECERFLIPISWVKAIVEFIVFGGAVLFSLLSIHTFWKSIFLLIPTFTIILLLDIYSDKIIYRSCKKSEKIRKEKYDEEVKRLKEENKAIRRRNLGINEEMEKFLKYADNILSDLKVISNSLKNYSELENESGKRVLTKIEGVISELGVLNEKLSQGIFETSYISTLYNIHLPKLLEYSKQFLEILNSKTSTENQIVKYSDLLEVFRIKISNHTQFLQDKAEDNFIIKITALNEDVMPDFDGSEVHEDE